MLAASSEIVRNLIESCLAFCNKRATVPIILAIPNEVEIADPMSLLNGSKLSGLVLSSELGVRRKGHPALGIFNQEQYDWELPKVQARTVAYLGPRRDISFRMVKKARSQGIEWLVYSSPGEWRRESTLGFLLIRVGERLSAEFQNRYLRLRKPIRRFYRAGVRKAARNGGSSNAFLRALNYTSQPLLRVFEKSYERKFNSVITSGDAPLLASSEFVPGRIVLANASLAWGGAERQVVNTMTGLKDRGYSDLLLVCQHLHDRPDHDFYYWQLEDADIRARELRRTFAGLGGDERIAKVARIINDLPVSLRDDIVAFAAEFLEIRPEIVHAWQDSTSIKAGFAAALVGVPKVILNGRNMAPYNFNYFLPYMRRAYTALSQSPNIRFVNNSHAGAADYESWVGLPSGTVHVLFNGVKSDAIENVPDHELRDYRRRLGIPDDAKVVGSMYRLYEEKGPLLWINTAAKIAQEVPNAVFLLVGKGPFADRIRELAATHGIGHRLFMPGTEKRAELPLSIMDVFLLTSRLEGTPNVCIEAQWLGVPVVAPNVGGTADTVLDGETGWIVEHRNKRSLAERVIWTLQHEQWRDGARARARCFARERFGFDRMIDDTLELYGLQ